MSVEIFEEKLVYARRYPLFVCNDVMYPVNTLNNLALMQLNFQI